jgi:hypothetical protein
VGEYTWSPADERWRSIRSWAKDLEYVDVVELAASSGLGRFAALTPHGFMPLDASSKDAAVAAVVSSFPVEAMSEVIWEDSWDGDGEMRYLESWSNDEGFHDVVQIRRFPDESEGRYEACVEYWWRTQDDWGLIDEITDDGASGTGTAGKLLDDMRLPDDG